MILVTGGTGLVGAHLLYKLMCNTENVKAMYRQEKKLDIVKKVFSYYTDDVQSLYDKIEWIKADLLDIPSLILAFKDVKRVYHCAAFVSYEPDKYQLLRKTNIEGTANIVNLAIDYNIEKLCYVSSITTIGSPLNDEASTEETQWDSEADNSVYAITKYGAEMEVWRAAQEGLKVIIVNPGVIIGAGIWRYGSGSIIKRVFKGLPFYTSGSAGYIDVNDVVKAMVLLMESSIENERFILVAENWTFKRFLQTIARALSVKEPKSESKTWMLQLTWRLDWLKHKLTRRRRGLTRHLVIALEHNSKYSNAKLKQHLNFEFKPIEESIREVSQRFIKDS